MNALRTSFVILALALLLIAPAARAGYILSQHVGSADPAGPQVGVNEGFVYQAGSGSPVVQPLPADNAWQIVTANLEFAFYQHALAASPLTVRGTVKIESDQNNAADFGIFVGLEEGALGYFLQLSRDSNSNTSTTNFIVTPFQGTGSVSVAEPAGGPRFHDVMMIRPNTSTPTYRIWLDGVDTGLDYSGFADTSARGLMFGDGSGGTNASGTADYRLAAAYVPEPATLALAGLLAAPAIVRRRCR
jgi:hypothetical protein